MSLSLPNAIGELAVDSDAPYQPVEHQETLGGDGISPGDLGKKGASQSTASPHTAGSLLKVDTD